MSEAAKQHQPALRQQPCGRGDAVRTLLKGCLLCLHCNREQELLARYTSAATGPSAERPYNGQSCEGKQVAVLKVQRCNGKFASSAARLLHASSDQQQHQRVGHVPQLLLGRQLDDSRPVLLE